MESAESVSAISGHGLPDIPVNCDGAKPDDRVPLQVDREAIGQSVYQTLLPGALA